MELTSILTTVGAARVSTSFGMGVPVIFSYWAWLCARESVCADIDNLLWNFEIFLFFKFSLFGNVFLLPIRLN